VAPLKSEAKNGLLTLDDKCTDEKKTLASFSKISKVPLPKCTSKSTMATLCSPLFLKMKIAKTTFEKM
tara:strand:+ start:708 stop:911 length:204 start_codon:yes stop_codon:yes gene_type:complete